MTGVPRAVGLLVGYLLLTAALLPVQMVLLTFGLPGQRPPATSLPPAYLPSHGIRG